MNKFKLFSAVALLILLLSSITPASPVQAAKSDVPSAAVWCGKLSSYTTWWKSKPILYVWKGKGRGNPYAVSVYFDGKYVANADNGIRVDSPQVDNNNGWVGYFLSTRWYLTHSKWDDDRRWEVRACLP
jgi:hypothetical protein